MFYYETIVTDKWIPHTSSHRPETRTSKSTGRVTMVHGGQHVRRIQEVPEELRNLSLKGLQTYFSKGEEK